MKRFNEFIDEQSKETEKKAQNAVGNAIRDGRMKRSSKCEDCGKTGVDIDAHHPDYRKKYEVVWLCKSCHSLRHQS